MELNWMAPFTCQKSTMAGTSHFLLCNMRTGTSWNRNDQKYEPITLYDPLNIHQDANGTWKRVPFGPSDTINPTPAPNIIPASRINPMAQKIIKMYPAPNTTPPTGSNPFANN